MSGTDRLTPSRLRGLTRPSLGAGRHEPQLYRRRRGAVALAALAALSLLVGLAVGAGAGGTPVRHVAALGTGYFAQIRTLAGGGPDSFISSERAAETAAINRTLGYTPYVRVAGSQHREMALSFDDGPGPYTPAILTALERQHAPATFFEVGVLEHYFNASTSAIVARGYPIGDHTESHAPMSRLSMRAERTAEGHGGDRGLRRPVPPALPPTVRFVERDHAEAAPALPDADGALDGGHR